MTRSRNSRGWLQGIVDGFASIGEGFASVFGPTPLPPPFDGANGTEDDWRKVGNDMRKAMGLPPMEYAKPRKRQPPAPEKEQS